MKTVFCDVDGTFYNYGDTIPQINLDAIKALQEQGDHFVFVSGRSPEQILYFLDENEIKCDIIFGNGAGYKLANEDANYEFCLNQNEIVDIIKLLDEENIFYHVHTSAGIYLRPMSLYSNHISELREWFNSMGDYGKKVMDFKENYFTEECSHVDSVPAFLEQHPELHVLKIEFMEASDEHIEKIKDKLSKMGFFVYSSFHTQMEIVHEKCSKGNAIRSYLERFPSLTTYGFGDEENDLPMLEAVDVPIAVANAKQSVKDRSKVIVEDANAGGVGKYIFAELIQAK